MSNDAAMPSTGAGGEPKKFSWSQVVRDEAKPKSAAAVAAGDGGDAPSSGAAHDPLPSGKMAPATASDGPAFGGSKHASAAAAVASVPGDAAGARDVAPQPRAVPGAMTVEALEKEAERKLRLGGGNVPHASGGNFSHAPDAPAAHGAPEGAARASDAGADSLSANAPAAAKPAQGPVVVEAPKPLKPAWGAAGASMAAQAASSSPASGGASGAAPHAAMSPAPDVLSTSSHSWPTLGDSKTEPQKRGQPLSSAANQAAGIAADGGGGGGAGAASAPTPSLASGQGQSSATHASNAGQGGSAHASNNASGGYHGGGGGGAGGSGSGSGSHAGGSGSREGRTRGGKDSQGQGRPSHGHGHSHGEGSYGGGGRYGGRGGMAGVSGDGPHGRGDGSHHPRGGRSQRGRRQDRERREGRRGDGDRGDRDHGAMNGGEHHHGGWGGSRSGGRGGRGRGRGGGGGGHMSSRMGPPSHAHGMSGWHQNQSVANPAAMLGNAALATNAGMAPFFVPVYYGPGAGIGGPAGAMGYQAYVHPSAMGAMGGPTHPGAMGGMSAGMGGMAMPQASSAHAGQHGQHGTGGVAMGGSMGGSMATGPGTPSAAGTMHASALGGMGVGVNASGMAAPPGGIGMAGGSMAPLPQTTMAGQAAQAQGSKSSVLEAVRVQVEYYFSAQNLQKDYFLRGKMDDDGWIEISVIANFNRVRALAPNPAVIAEALVGSTLVELSSAGDGIRAREWQQWTLPAEQRQRQEAKSGLKGGMGAGGRGGGLAALPRPPPASPG